MWVLDKPCIWTTVRPAASPALTRGAEPMTTDIVTRGNTDPDATEIGKLYARARGSMVDAVRQAIACGEKLITKKKNFAHGHWNQWLQANAEILGFGERTARLLM